MTAPRRNQRILPQKVTGLFHWLLEISRPFIYFLLYFVNANNWSSWHLSQEAYSQKSHWIPTSRGVRQYEAIKNRWSPYAGMCKVYTLCLLLQYTTKYLPKDFPSQLKTKPFSHQQKNISLEYWKSPIMYIIQLLDLVGEESLQNYQRNLTGNPNSVALNLSEYIPLS